MHLNVMAYGFVVASSSSLLGQSVVRVEGSPIWMTAVVAFGAAMLGAVIGAFATYRANVALDDRARTARAAIRRKAKIYTPLRIEVVDLRDWLLNNPAPFRPIGVELEPEWRRAYRRWPSPFLWVEMKEDGRAVTASSRVREVMEDVLLEIECFNAALEDVAQRLEVILRRASEAVMPDVSLPKGDLLSDISDLLLGRKAWPLWYVEANYADYENEEDAEAAQREIRQQIRNRVEGDPAFTEVRKKAQAAREALAGKLQSAINVLDETMETIARKYEKEPPED
jgi:hypothetical protein